MEDLLAQAKQIDVNEYIDLENPIFKGQTRPTETGEYWMVFESNGVLYKTFNVLF